MIEYCALAPRVMPVGGTSLMWTPLAPAGTAAVTSVPAIPDVPGSPALIQDSIVPPSVEL